MELYLVTRVTLGNGDISEDDLVVLCLVWLLPFTDDHLCAGQSVQDGTCRYHGDVFTFGRLKRWDDNTANPWGVGARTYTGSFVEGKI